MRVSSVGRPYPSLQILHPGWSTQHWMGVSPSCVELESLVLTQEQVLVAPLVAPLVGSFSGDPLPHIVRYRGVNYVEDGHHRVLRAWLAGKGTMQVRVFDVPRSEQMFSCVRCGVVRCRAGVAVCERCVETRPREMYHCLSCKQPKCPKHQSICEECVRLWSDSD